MPKILRHYSTKQLHVQLTVRTELRRPSTTAPPPPTRVRIREQVRVQRRHQADIALKREQLRAFYAEREPSKMSAVDTLVSSKYKFVNVVTSLRTKYGAVPDGWEIYLPESQRGQGTEKQELKAGAQEHAQVTTKQEQEKQEEKKEEKAKPTKTGWFW